MNKEELKKYISLKMEAETLKKQIDELEEDAKSLSSVVIDGMPKGSLKSDSVGRLILRIERKREEYFKKFDEVLCSLHKIEKAIETLDNPTERALIRKRYLEGKRWEDICEDLHYEWAQVHRIHARILKRLGSDTQ